jgi:group I intron endonuclease
MAVFFVVEWRREKNLSRISGIYKIVNIINGKLYIGLSVDIKHRWDNHRSELANNTHKNPHLQSSYNYYGLSSFEFSIVEECEPEVLDEKEGFWISFYKSSNREFGYNLHSWGDAKRITPEETKIRISIANKGKKRSEKHIAALKLRVLSEENKRQISETKKGNSPAWNEGKTGHLSESVKEKMRLSHDKNGEKSGTAKLTNEKVLIIAQMIKDGFGVTYISKEFGVSKGAISDIKSGRGWSHISGIPKSPRGKHTNTDRRGENTNVKYRKISNK